MHLSSRLKNEARISNEHCDVCFIPSIEEARRRRIPPRWMFQKLLTDEIPQWEGAAATSRRAKVEIINHRVKSVLPKRPGTREIQVAEKGGDECSRRVQKKKEQIAQAPSFHLDTSGRMICCFDG